jgi:very-short-patch-repair endonuclease
MVKAIYDYPRLKSFCDKNNITLINDYSKERINSRTLIEYKCVMVGCEKNHKARFSNLINNKNAYCKSCSDKSKNQVVVKKENSIAVTHYETAEQWHPTKNGELKPEHVSSGSHVIVWWLCKKTCYYGCKHEWKGVISNKCKGFGCPYCSKHSSREICIHDSIAFTHKDIAKQWHPTKNGELKPEYVTYGSEQNIWWLSSDCKHEWEAQISNRTGRGDGCTKCTHKTEKKLYDILIPDYSSLIKQYKVDWCKNKKHLPYDYAIEYDKIIIELDGEQHFKDVISWNSPLKEIHVIDVYKMKCANENGFSVIRIYQPDVWSDTYDWLTELRNNIEKIKLEKIIQNIYMCKSNEYEIFNN